MVPLSLRLVPLLACLPAPVFAGVHIVDATGRGDQLTLAAAVAIAHDGDVLLLRSGTYAGCEVDDKALVITTDAGANVTIEGTLGIGLLSANKTLVLAELVVHGPVSALGSGPALDLRGNRGHLRIEHCELSGGRGLGGNQTPWNPGARGVVLQDCADVAFSGCTIRGGDGEGTAPGQGFFDFGGAGGDAVRAGSSRAALYDCTLQGGAGGGGDGAGGNGGRGYAQLNGLDGAFLSRCIAHGGDGGYAWGFGAGGNGGDALFASATAQYQLLENVLQPGNGGQSTGFPFGTMGVIESGAGSFKDLNGNSRSLSATSLAASGGRLSVTATGLPGDRVFLLASDRTGFQFAPNLMGVLLELRSTQPNVGFLGVLPSAGSATFDYQLAALPSGLDTGVLYLQGLVEDPSGASTLATPFFVLRLRCNALQPDCNGNGSFDTCDLLDGSAQDLGHDGIPDSCDPDCNGNGVPDDLDILNGSSLDVNGNGIPDSCEGPFTIHVDAAAAPFGDGSASAPFQTIGEGVAAASTGDIVRIEDGTYTGALNRELGMGGRSIVIESAHGPANCIVDCQTLGRGFAVHEGESAPMAIRGLTIRNGSVKPQSWNPVRGGSAIVVDHAGMRIEDCVIESCSPAGGGSAVSGFVADLKIVNCAFRNNGTLTGGTGGGGLGVNAGTTELSRSVFEGNRANVGGALLTSAPSSIRISSCAFRGNSAQIYGGGVVLQSPAIVDDCLVSGNSAPNGGGISGGDGVWILNSTIAQNSATQSAGGIYAAFAATGGLMRLRNSVIWGNSAPTGAQIGSVSFFDTLQLRYCDLQGGSAGIALGAGTLNYDSTNIVSDPFFVSPAGLDGNLATWADNDLHIGLTSPCIDAGNNTLVPNDQLDLDQDGDTLELVPWDLDGAPRFRDIPTVIDTGAGSGPIIDIGVYERQP